MSTIKPRVTSFAPQFLVDDLERSIAYYQKIGFTFGEPWEGFYAIGVLDGLELHLKEAPKNDADRHHGRNNDHLLWWSCQILLNNNNVNSDQNTDS